MADYAAKGDEGALILFPGGKGSDDMFKRAKKYDLKIRRWKYD